MLKGQIVMDTARPGVSQIDLLDLIKSRRSVRKYQPRRPGLAALDRLIECAAYAPSAHNAQPWRFYVVNDESKRTALIEQMAARFRQDLLRDGVSPASTERKTMRSKQAFAEAPVLIIAGIDMARMDKYPDKPRQEAEKTMAVQSLAAAIQNLLLAARAMGLGGCWYCAPLFCPEIVRKALSLPEGFQPQALITLGYLAEEPTPPPRLSLNEIRYVL